MADLISPRVDSGLLTSDDCFQCRRCCHFEPDELVDAPTFTASQRTRAESEFAAEGIEFHVRGSLWQVVLRDIPGSQKKVCPFYEEETARCRVFSYGVFDCHTWPFYLMRKDGVLVVALSLDCPVVSLLSVDVLREHGRRVMGPRMLAVANVHPDLVTDLHGNVVVLSEIQPAP